MKFFNYEPIITKEQIKNTSGKKKKGERAQNWTYTLKRIFDFVAEQKMLLFIVLLLVVLSSAFALVGPFIIGRLIDQFIDGSSLSQLSYWLYGLAVIYLLYSFASYFQNYWMVSIAQQTVFRIRTQLYGHFFKLPLRFFDKRKHGELMSRATNDIETISSTLNSAFIQVVSSILTLTGTVAVMLWLSPLLTLITMLIVPLMFYGMRWITKRTSLLFKQQQAAIGEMNGLIEESITGQHVVKAFSQETEMLRQFDEKNTRIRTVGFWALTYSGFIPKVMNTLNSLSFAIVALAGGLFAYYGHISIGTIIIFTEYARQFTRPLNDLANQFNTVLSALAGAERVFLILDEKEDEIDGENMELLGNVRFQNVSFQYDAQASSPTLSNVSFEVKSGQSVALIGQTGAGKTTIMQLLTGLYEKTDGKIVFDDMEIEEISKASLRSQMAFVLQDPFLFEMSIKDNIRYGKLDATDEEIYEAAKKANAHTFIDKLPEKYDTILSADGSQISQGQKQLLSIARAFVADPKILLLDEATSSIDTVTELHIQEALEKLMEDRTSFIIAHRLNTIRKVDYVIVLNQGKIIEQGNRQELIENQGVFGQMLNV
ncbi:ABC-type multidrug transport system, ATPase and permease component [Solibacillus isronensis B3W22]|uniref:ABC-type multidrug transport system, ATPase and permease component n=1 Tax=Solibacillus isronensis B3W22 TaxID=1224748 RepID=K1LR46_9BACL|nr:ABC transporter ATP-binding protein [Solibacillus isronensis]AMO85991.1 multidrug ABC transporter ATP-binding protein [Solibacillus silvestris]EKB46664.1 ABC-type multidrug transport system, ATPase and permease component [Solibacillus isronensis B3W22]